MDLGKYHGYSLTRQVQIACSAGRVLPHNALAVLASTAIRHFHKKRTNEMYYGIRENGWHCAIKQVTHSISHAV